MNCRFRDVHGGVCSGIGDLVVPVGSGRRRWRWRHVRVDGRRGSRAGRTRAGQRARHVGRAGQLARQAVE
jgi:hypothetical protein